MRRHLSGPLIAQNPIQVRTRIPMAKQLAVYRDAALRARYRIEIESTTKKIEPDDFVILSTIIYGRSFFGHVTTAHPDSGAQCTAVFGSYSAGPAFPLWPPPC